MITMMIRMMIKRLIFQSLDGTKMQGVVQYFAAMAVPPPLARVGLLLGVATERWGWILIGSGLPFLTLACQLRLDACRIRRRLRHPTPSALSVITIT